MRIRCSRQDILDSLLGKNSNWYHVNECDNGNPYASVWVAMKWPITLDQGSMMLTYCDDGYKVNIGRWACTPPYKKRKLSQEIFDDFVKNIKSSYAPYVQMPQPRKQTLLQKLFNL